MARIPLTLRMLVLLPLLAAGVDLTRATVVCGSEAQTCLGAAGRGWLGPVAVALIVFYAMGAGVLLARHVSRSPAATPGFSRLWATATAALLITAAGQDALTRVLGADASLGGSPLGMLLVCAAFGALLAVFMRAAARVGELRARAPRLPRRTFALIVLTGRDPASVPVTAAAPRRGRAPPQPS